MSRKASSREIRRAYRELARKYHPDFNPGDETAAKKFREIHEAYEILGDPKKRKAFDYYGVDFGDRVPARAPDSASQQAGSVSRPGVAGPRASANRGADSMRRTAPDFANVLHDYARSYRYRPAVGFPRLVNAAQLVYLTVPLVFVVGTLLYLALPDAGMKEFERAQEALKHVQSWKVERQLSGSGSAVGESLTEVSCPSSQRTTQHIRSTAPATRDLTIESIAIGYDSYYRTSWTNGSPNRWTRSPSAGSAAAFACPYLQRAQDATGMPPFHQWLSGSYVIEKENLRQTADGRCREWKVVAPGGYSRPPDMDFVCLDVKDHLPRFRGAPGTIVEEHFYDWNVPNEIVAPPLNDSL